MCLLLSCIVFRRFVLTTFNNWFQFPCNINYQTTLYFCIFFALLPGHPFSLAHFRTSIWWSADLHDWLAAIAHVIASQRPPLSFNHSNISMLFPFAAAVPIKSGSQGAPFSFNQFNTFTCSSFAWEKKSMPKKCFSISSK